MTIQDLINKASFFTKIKNENELFQELKQLTNAELQNIGERFQPNRVFAPVVLLRFLVVQLLLKKEEVSANVISEIKAAIEARDISKYYTPSQEYLESLRNYKDSKKGMFPQWKEPFAILYSFFYPETEKVSTMDFIKGLGQKIINKNNIENAVVHAVGFDGAQNYGDHSVWGAIIPEQAESVQKAYQIFFRISESGVVGGLLKGHKLDNNGFKRTDIDYDSWDSYLEATQNILPEWEQENSKINFTLHTDEKDFIKRLKQSSIESNELFFTSIDMLINDLQIPEEDNLTFSTNQERLSFHIGSRYCLSMHKNQFGFISPRKLQLSNAKEESFSGEPEAFWYYNNDAEVLQENFERVMEATQNEFNRGHAAKNESYKNVAFQKAVFDKTYRQRLFDQYLFPQYKGTVWKLDCNWGKEADNFYDMLVSHNIVIGEKERDYHVDDLIAITEGFKVIAVAKVSSSPVACTSLPNLEQDFNKYKIDYEERVNVSDAVIYKLRTKDQLEYQLPKGPRKIQQKDISSKVISLWNSYNSNLKVESEKEQKPIMRNTSLNQILYGPPGTGKTYNSIDYALKAINGNEENELLWTDRAAVKSLFDKRVSEGRIIFATFHQSMTYEDFIEGIKPQTKDGKVTYEIQDGIFKSICYKALFAHYSNGNQKQLSQYSEFDSLFDSYIENVDQRLNGLKDGKQLLLELKSKGYYTEVKSINEEEEYFLTRGTRANSDAKVYKERLRLLYNKFPSVEDIKDVSVDIRSVGPGLGWSSNYYGVFNDLKKFEAVSFSRNTDLVNDTIDYTNIERIKSFIDSSPLLEVYKEDADPFVIIIDEINRGNVSQIFGELITLIEDDKRAGADNQLEVKLPYSKSKFSVPPNLYIIGTMNTADRSIEALDTALRRRFSFVEMQSKPELITELNDFNEVNLQTLLETINYRIEILVDKDHMIGHSYFLKVSSLNDLKAVFQNKIIPLLQEYFFGDYGKIGLVLGNGFVTKTKPVSDNPFAEFDYESSSFSEKPIYDIVKVTDMNDEEFTDAINILIK